MKKLLIILLIASGIRLQGQESLQTIFVNESNNVALFFPSPVQQGVAGASHFTFSFNEDQAQHFGLLKGLPGKSSNLLVLTMDGRVYSYLLEYRDRLPKLNYFIAPDQSIGLERPTRDTGDLSDGVEEDQVAISGNDEALISGAPELEAYSKRLLQASRGNLKTRRSRGLRLRVQDMIYHQDMVLMVFEMKNRSRIDFELNYLHVYLTQGNRRRNASFQKLLKEPVYALEVPSVIESGQTRRFLYALPKFTASKHERIEVEMREGQGNRVVRLRLRPH